MSDAETPPPEDTAAEPPRARRRSRASQAADPAGQGGEAGPRRRRKPPAWTPRQVRLLASGCASAIVLASLVLAGQAGALDGTGTWLKQRFLNASAALGLGVDAVLVAGRHQTGRDALRQALDVSRGDPILAVDPEAARRRVVALPWVRNARVGIELPGTLRAELTERRPVARWQHDGQLAVVDDKGTVVAQARPGQFAELPRVTGPGAAEAAPDLLAVLAERPSIAQGLDHARRVERRRWDLQMKRGIVLRLPAKAPGKALDRFLRVERKHDLAKRAITAIDLRLDDRLVVQLNRPAAQAYGDNGLIHVNRAQD